jgi:hypothetical protein
MIEQPQGQDFLIALFGNRENVREVMRQFRVMQAECPWAMKALAAFCYAEETTAVLDNANDTWLRQGKREVWLFIQAMAALTERDITHVPPREETGPVAEALDLPPVRIEEDEDNGPAE